MDIFVIICVLIVYRGTVFRSRMIMYSRTNQHPGLMFIVFPTVGFARKSVWEGLSLSLSLSLFVSLSVSLLCHSHGNLQANCDTLWPFTNTHTATTPTRPFVALTLSADSLSVCVCVCLCTHCADLLLKICCFLVIINVGKSFRQLQTVMHYHS